MSYHVVVDITGHGFGHFAQTAPVLLALQARMPGLRFTLRTAVPEAVIRETLGPGVSQAPPPADIGLVMTGPLDVDRAASAAAYADLHADWPGVVAAEAGRLAALRPDALVSNVAYSSVAAAATIGVPAVALSSLNWADLYGCYCADHSESRRIHAEIVAAYASARLFVQVTPHLPMSDLANRRSVGPVARQGVCVRTALKARLGARPGDRLVLVTLGGIAMGDDVRALPQVAGVRWLVAGPGMAGQEEVVSAAGLGYAFSDLIRACDAVITKPGYGTIVEAVCGGTRVIICARADWPETPHLDAWAQRCGVATMISRASLRSGDYGPTLAALLARPAPPPVAADGVLTAAALVADVLAG